MTRKTRVIGVYVSSLLNQRDAAILQEASRITRENGLLLAIASSDPTQAQAEQALQTIHSLIERNCDAVLVHCPELNDESRSSLQKSFKDITFLDMRPELSSNEFTTTIHLSAGITAGRVLKEKRHRNVAILTRGNTTDGVVVGGFLEEFSPYRSKLCRALTVKVRNNVELSAEISKILAATETYTALFCTDPQLATYAAQCLQMSDVEIPSGISVLTYDAYFILEQRFLDSIQPSMIGITRQAMRALLTSHYSAPTLPDPEALTIHLSGTTVGQC
ncbi:substrate-binding domain-containing protein [Paraburkholderia sp. Ac-20340]|uniref:substrate-binding domain-containing protein n=1 Tax=Paraburkholderia sp. Ac-20340 TaxID=2703888 RepID=UPI003217D8FA